MTLKKMASKGSNPFESLKKSLTVAGEQLQYYSLPALNDARYEFEEIPDRGEQQQYYSLPTLNEARYEKLPFSIRVLLESAVRNCDDFYVLKTDVEKILDWEVNQSNNVEIPFKPSRVILQDFTGVPAVVDFAAMRDAVSRLGGDPEKINPVCPADLVIDHSIQVDVSRSNLTHFTPNPGGGQSQVKGQSSCQRSKLSGKNAKVIGQARTVACNLCSKPRAPGIPESELICPFHRLRIAGAEALEQNQMLEFERNGERFVFLKWGAKALKNMLIVPPGSGIVHQVNLEYLARVVFNENKLLYPDSLVGTDSHTTMINGLGIVGWGVGGIEAEAVMLGQSISMVLPEVVGYKLTGTVNPLTTSTDIVLTITKHLRSIGVVGKFVEFFGPGVAELSIADRATISNMCPEYGATVGYFPVDEKSLSYLRQTGRDEGKIEYISTYMKANKMFRDFTNAAEDPIFTQIIELDLSSVVPCCSGPKRPHDKVAVAEMKTDFRQCLQNKAGFKGFGIREEKQSCTVPFLYEKTEYRLSHGSVVIAAITSCTNTSNPSVMLGAGLLAKKAVEAGLGVKPYIKTSLSPGSGVVTYYLRESGVTPYLEKLGFDIVGYGCMTCIGNSGPLPTEVSEAIEKGDLVACGILSGNRNFEGRIHPLTRANYLASPPLVIAYALAGRADIDFETEPLGTNSEGNPVFLRDIWPSRDEIHAIEEKFVIPSMFNEVYSRIQKGNERWNYLEAPEGTLYPWDSKSTYIQSPPFFQTMTKELPKIQGIKDAHVLLNFGDSVTTDHISPAGSIARNSPAARYLASHGLTPREFNSYGSRRGNDAIMARGTFANIRLVNKFMKKPGPRTLYLPTGEEMDVFDAAERYRSEDLQVMILAGKEYGSGSSRDWAAKGPWMLGVRAVIAESYERIHRSNLVGMGIIPFQYLPNETSETLGLSGRETITVDLPQNIQPGQIVTAQLSDGRTFQIKARFDTEVELVYFRHGGILNYMVRRMLE